MIESGSSPKSAESFVAERLQSNPELDFATLQREAEQAGYAIQPIQFGRARRSLGLTGAGKPTGNANSAPQSPADAPPRPQPSNAGEANAEAPAKPIRGYDFLVESLRAEPTLSYGELKARADELDLKIAPIMYGRAKAQLGLVPVRPRGSGKARRQASQLSRSQVSEQGQSSAQRDKQLDNVQNIDQLVEIVKKLEAERRQLRGLLTRIANSIDEALGYDD